MQGVVQDRADPGSARLNPDAHLPDEVRDPRHGEEVAGETKSLHRGHFVGEAGMCGRQGEGTGTGAAHLEGE